jgi:hypothetical protein
MTVTDEHPMEASATCASPNLWASRLNSSSTACGGAWPLLPRPERGTAPVLQRLSDHYDSEYLFLGNTARKRNYGPEVTAFNRSPDPRRDHRRQQRMGIHQAVG